jgi:hypothetical protein
MRDVVDVAIIGTAHTGCHWQRSGAGPKPTTFVSISQCG